MKLPKLPKLPKFGRGKAKAAADEEVDDLAGLLDDDDNDAAAADDAEDDAPPARPGRPAARSPAADDDDGDTGDDTGLKDPDGDEPDLDAGADDAPPERGGNDDDDDFVPEDPDDNDDGNFASSFDDEDEAARPAWRNPILLSSVGVAVLLGIGLAWLAASFDWEGYQQSTQPRMQVAALPPALPAGAVPAAAAPAATQAPAAAVGAPAPAATQGAATPATPAATPPAATPQGARAPTATPATAPAAVPAAPAAAPAQAVALAAVPDPALVAPGADGPLPVIAPDGRQAWDVYARPFTAPAGTSKIAIVVGGLGLSQAATRAAIQQLPGVVTLAFAPNAPNLQDWIAEARAAGHEVVLQLPMEPEGFPANDPGPYTLLANATAADNLERLHWLLSRFTGYVGVTNYLGTKLSTQANALKPILADLRERGLLFLDSRETNDSVAGKVAAELKLPRVINNRFIDASASRTGVDRKLAELERIATATGTAVGIGYPYPVTIERVTEWAKSLPGKNIVLAPVSAVAAVDPVN